MPKLVGREIGRRAPAEVDEVWFAPAHERFVRIEGELAQHGVNVVANRGRILVRIDLEIAKMAALPAERDMDVHAQQIAGPRRTLKGRVNLARAFRFPE